MKVLDNVLPEPRTSEEVWGRWINRMQVLAIKERKQIPIKEMFACLNCKKPFVENGFQMYCGERCEVLTDQALDVIRGK
jgi:hypothetical protein